MRANSNAKNLTLNLERDGRMDANEFDLFLNFVIRNRRFLKKRETSFTEKQLDEGRKRVEKAVKAVEKMKIPEAEMEAWIKNPAKCAKIATEMRKVSKVTPKQAKLMAENFKVFQSAVRQPTAPKLIFDQPKNDRFYAPKPHNYR